MEVQEAKQFEEVYAIFFFLEKNIFLKKPASPRQAAADFFFFLPFSYFRSRGFAFSFSLSFSFCKQKKKQHRRKRKIKKKRRKRGQERKEKKKTTKTPTRAEEEARRRQRRGGGSDPLPRLPPSVQLSGRCQNRCRGNVPPQTGQPAALVPEGDHHP